MIRTFVASTLLLLTASLAAQQTMPESFELSRGLKAFAQHCAVCHGSEGGGDGIAARWLDPQPRTFLPGDLRFVSGSLGRPTDADLATTIRHGLPGSAMPGWNQLSDGEIDGLVLATRHYMVEARAKNILAAGLAESADEARRAARDDLEPGPIRALPARPDDTDVTLGRQVYERSCIICHGADGRGRTSLLLTDRHGQQVRPRDMTRGVFKGPSDDASLARRILLGIPGTPMPPTVLDARQLWSLVDYVGTLIDRDVPAPDNTGGALVRAVHAERVPDDPGDAAWDAAPATTLWLMPLRWRDERVETVEVRGLHDGTDLALRLSWRDPTADDTRHGEAGFVDASAVQLAAAPNPPFLAMGSPETPVEVWSWRAVWERASEHEPFALTQTGRGPGIPAQPTFFGDGDPFAPRARESDLPVRRSPGTGPGTFLTHGFTAEVSALAWRQGTRWEVVYRRALASESVPLVPGQRRPLALAIWDGHVGDHGANKSITAWHMLEIAAER